MEFTNGSKIGSIKSSVHNNTYDVSDMKTQPVAVREEWDCILYYAAKKSRLPGQYDFRGFYKTSTSIHLCTKLDVQNSMIGGDITFYLPTKGCT